MKAAEESYGKVDICREVLEKVLLHPSMNAKGVQESWIRKFFGVDDDMAVCMNGYLGAASQDFRYLCGVRLLWMKRNKLWGLSTNY